ncbi:MAG: 2-(1,2-epoxy-1,2-dihydrophenyl)acetyl-CoA isomerase [Acidobacteriota bacterium]|nr:MAG: 2-(1,2-epoxy-1,2-dihydrophenyl)acetyl-CoA isomerase [Acidobacteriota bacterium]
MAYQFIKYELERSVAKITLSRPEVLNSFHRPMALELQAALDEARDDATVRAVYLTGAGRAFSAGQDLAEAVPPDGSAPPNIGEIVRTSYNPIVRRIRQLEKPVVCAVNGVAAGVGANIALACDLVVAAEEASFLQAFTKIGLIPDGGGTFFLPRLVGFARATEMMMLGEKITARQALEAGLIYKIVPSSVLEQEALGLAVHLATQPTKGLGLTKRALNRSFANDLETQLGFEADLQSAAGETEDYKEGVQAFLGKRKPQFKGN